MLIEWAKHQILSLYRDNAAIIAAIVDRRLSLGSPDADRRRVIDYQARNSELLAVILSW
jgi:hypothetical protein